MSTTTPEVALNRKRQALALLTLVAVAVVIRLSMPMGFGLFSGVLLAFVLQPVYDLLRKRGLGSGFTALLCALGSSLVLAGIMYGLGYVLASELINLLQTLPKDLAPGGSLHESMIRAANFLREHHIDPDEQLQKLKETLAASGGQFAAMVLGAVGSLLVFFLIMTMANFNVLLRWDKIVALAERDLPLAPGNTRKIFREFQQVGRHVVFGTIATGLIQGALESVVCLVTGVPKALFFGAATAVLSLIPVVGVLGVWGGVGIFRIATGHVTSGVLELILGVVFVGILADDVIRPKLVGGGKKFPTLLTFIGLIGGMSVFGASGLIVGPILVSLCAAVLKIYTDQSEPIPRKPAKKTTDE